MPTTRLTQIGLPGASYEEPTDVQLTQESWGWTSYPVDVSYEILTTTRLGQYGIALAAYFDEEPVSIGISQQDWGWTSYPITVDFLDPQIVDLTKQDWGWTPQNLIVCAQSTRGWYGSFNDAVWNSCVFNDYVFGKPTHVVRELDRNHWGWTSYPVEIAFADPVDIPLARQDWGWFAYPVAVSFQYDIQLGIMPWGWTSYPITVSLPVDIDLSQADWGWRSHPVAVSHGADVGIAVGTWGWQSFPFTVDVPVFDVRMRKADWGWQSFPMQVRQTALLPGDIEAIADAVYDKFVAEGVIQQIAETWQRQGCDPSYPQTYAPTSITVGGMTIDIDTKSGRTTQTRQ